MARFISEAANSAHRAHQAGASFAGSLAAHRLTSTSLTVRSRGRLHHCASCVGQVGAPYLGS